MLNKKRTLYLLCLIMFTASSYAGKIVLSIKALNPIDKIQTVNIRSSLPAGATTNDIISLDGLELGYDYQQGVYYVFKSVELGPKENRTFDVEINDIWRISDDELSVLETQAEKLTAMLAGTDSVSNALPLNAGVKESVNAIRVMQNANALGAGVPPMQHIRAFQVNSDVLKKVRKDVGYIENLVLGEDMDPGSIVGDVDLAPKERNEAAIPDDKYKLVKIRMSVQNRSDSEERTIDFNRYLPGEIRMEDIVDPAGLDYAYDQEKDACFLYRKDMTLKPGETLDFDILVRDRWNINQPLIKDVKQYGQRILKQVEESGINTAIAEITDSLKKLDAIEQEPDLENLTPDYIAYYRAQRERITALERKINRIDTAMQPQKKPGFDVKPPSIKTTWIIIYIILGFLMILSILFFSRWSMKGSDEKMKD